MCCSPARPLDITPSIDGINLRRDNFPHVRVPVQQQVEMNNIVASEQVCDQTIRNCHTMVDSDVEIVTVNQKKGEDDVVRVRNCMKRCNSINDYDQGATVEVGPILEGWGQIASGANDSIHNCSHLAPDQCQRTSFFSLKEIVLMILFGICGKEFG